MNDSDVAVRVGEVVRVRTPRGIEDVVVEELYVWAESLLDYCEHPEAADAEFSLAQLLANGGRNVGVSAAVGGGRTHFILGTHIIPAEG
jgi:hypothetical protein